jgi:hypothetical protein
MALKVNCGNDENDTHKQRYQNDEEVEEAMIF